MNSVEARKGLKTFLFLLPVAGLVFATYKFIPQGYNYLSYARDLAQTRNHRIQGLTPNSVTIVWETKREVAGGLLYGTDPNSLNRFAPEEKKRKAHRIKIENLQSQTTYYYRIKLDNKAGRTVYQFTTLSE
ncbi:MAG: fibronectin type III domain-containing protein [Patescibacteria group bacterium]